MQRPTNITIDQKTLFVGGTAALLLVAVGMFISTVFVHFVHPFFLAKDEQVSGITLDTAIDDVANKIRTGRDLTPNTPSATLIEEVNIATFSGVESSPSGETIGQ